MSAGNAEKGLQGHRSKVKVIKRGEVHFSGRGVLMQLLAVRPLSVRRRDAKLIELELFLFLSIELLHCSFFV